MLIKKVHIEKFRGFHDQEFEVGSMLTAIAVSIQPLFWRFEQ